MTISFVLFGCMSFDLIRLVTANADYLSTYGLIAFQEDGLQQFIELWLKALATMFFWIMFKVCEGNLVDAIANKPV